ncbi:MAG: hypothetical protein ABL893_03045 [Hyphomicrobium sp.]
MRLSTHAAVFVSVIGLTAGLPISAGHALDASRQWLAGSAIVDALSGKTIEGSYASGRAFIERYLPDGRVEYVEGNRMIGGHWSVTEGTLCTIYDNDPTGGCFRVTRAGANCFECYFAARTEAAAPGPEDRKPKWTARGSIPGEGAACQDGADV